MQRMFRLSHIASQNICDILCNNFFLCVCSKFKYMIACLMNNISQLLSDTVWYESTEKYRAFRFKKKGRGHFWKSRHGNSCVTILSWLISDTRKELYLEIFACRSSSDTAGPCSLQVMFSMEICPHMWRSCGFYHVVSKIRVVSQVAESRACRKEIARKVLSATCFYCIFVITR